MNIRFLIKGTRPIAFFVAFILCAFCSGLFTNTASAAPGLSTTLVISQVNGGGGGSTGTYLFDYVEIKNKSAAPQSLNGLSLYYGSATGNFASTAGNAFALPNVTLNPGQYFFIQTGPTGSAGSAFPVMPDATTANLTMSGTSGKVALVTSALAINTCGATATPCSTAQLGMIVDWVAYGAAGNGTAGNGEGGTSVNNGVAITSSQGSVRKTGGCTETDNNNLDFDVVTAPVPRNTGTPAAPCTPVVGQKPNVDFDGDGKTDFYVVRETATPLAENAPPMDRTGNFAGSVRERLAATGKANLGISAPIFWYRASNPSGAATGVFGPFGQGATDSVVPADFDGDGKMDITVFRPALAPNQFFHIMQSQTNTLRSVELGGLPGDDPFVSGDFDGDGKADPAIYRTQTGGQNFFYYRSSTSNYANIVFEPWGSGASFAAPGDYDGDGKQDFCIQVDAGGGAGRFWLRKSSGGVEVIDWGRASDLIAPGDYDGDGKSDFCVVRNIGGQLNWFILERDGGTQSYQWGLFASDQLVPGDYDGDGKQDVAIWRPNADPAQNFYYIRKSSDGALQAFEWGTTADYPLQNWYVH